MTYELKLEKHGESMALVLPKEVLALVSSNGGTVFLSESRRGEFSLSATDPRQSDAYKSQMAAAEEAMRRYPNTLRELAK